MVWKPVVAVFLILLGGYIIVTAPPDPVYSVQISGPNEVSENQSTVAFQNLSEEQKDVFLDELDGNNNYADEPEIPDDGVVYEGTVYYLGTGVAPNTSSRTAESLLGVLFIVAGGVVAVSRCRELFQNNH